MPGTVAAGLDNLKDNFMCFSSEADWYASINVETYWQGDKPCTCEECGREIAVGEWRKNLEQQEREECQICEYEDGEPCADDDHDYGETYSGDTCRECLLVLAAIYEIEEIEKCPEHSRQPQGCQLYDELQHNIDARGPNYVGYAMLRFPELTRHKALLHLVA